MLCGDDAAVGSLSKLLDELVLGLTTLLLANWKRKPEPAGQPARRAVR